MNPSTQQKVYRYICQTDAIREHPSALYIDPTTDSGRFCGAAAEQGRLAHKLLFWKLSTGCGYSADADSQKEYADIMHDIAAFFTKHHTWNGPQDGAAAMDAYTTGVYQSIESLRAKTHGVMYIEPHIRCGKSLICVPDIVIVSDIAKNVTVIEFKYGLQQIHIEQSSALGVYGYACGRALHIEPVTLVMYQPRASIPVQQAHQDVHSLRKYYTAAKTALQIA